MLKNAEKGDTICFGSYGSSSIEWIVLENNNSKLLLLSKNNLFKNQYSETEDSCANSWYGSTLRTNLNSSFFRTSFDMDEKELIQKSKILITNNLNTEE